MLLNRARVWYAFFSLPKMFSNYFYGVPYEIYDNFMEITKIPRRIVMTWRERRGNRGGETQRKTENGRESGRQIDEKLTVEKLK